MKTPDWVKRLWAFSDSYKCLLLLSHLTPLLLIILLVGAALSYALETNRILKDMTGTIQEQSELIRSYARENPEVLTSSSAAEEFIREIRPSISSGVVLLDSSLNVLSISGEVGSVFPGQSPSFTVDFSPQPFSALMSVSRFNPFRNSGDVIVMMVPVTDDADRLLGVIRLNFPSTYFADQLEHTMKWIYLILIGGVALDCALSLFLGSRIESRLNRTTRAIYDFSEGMRGEPLPEEGPEEMRRLAVAFNSFAEKLDRSEQARAKLTSHLTHELGRPLGALRSAVDALQRGAWEEEELARELTGGMKTEIKRLENLVDDLALLREGHDPSLKYVMVPTKLVDWLKEVYVYWVPFARSRSIDLQDEFADDIPEVNIDRDRFAQAIGNLISNALKYSPSGGTVILRAEQEGETVKIEVIDHGTGIEAEALPHIFEPFYRGQLQRRIVQGMGLGLSIVQEVAAAHGGSISVESVEGQGSTFTLRIPIPLTGPLTHDKQTFTQS